MPEDRIVSQGEEGDCLYLIAQGDCVIWVVDHLRRNQRVRELKQGDYFGEVSLLYSTTRTATVKSSNYCTLAQLNRKSFADLCNNYPEIMFKMKQRVLKYDDPWKKFKTAVLSRVDYFKDYADDPEFLEEIHLSMEEEYVDKGIEIAGPDQDMKSIFFLVEGRADIVVFDKEGNEHVLDVLNQGDLIG